ncbi:caspase family protein [Streptomyces humi]
MRRLFYALGAGNYHVDGRLGPLGGVEADLARMTELFTGQLGYVRRPATPFLDRTAREVRTDLVAQDDEPFTVDDTLVVYYTGHGEHIRDRHYLMCPDSDRAKPTSTALPTEDLVRIFTERNARRLLLIVDTCQAAGGAADAIRQVAHQVAVGMGRQNDAFNARMVSFSVISAARRYQVAGDSAFRTALESAIRSGECGGIRSRKLLLETVVEVVSEKLRELGHDQQDATLATLMTDSDDPPFLPNPRYDPDAPPEGTSVAELRNWAGSTLPPEEKRAAAVGRFTGRAEALARLRAWVFDTVDTSSPFAVSGAPGTGKSALLAEFRRLLAAETGAPGVLPPLTVALVDARDRSADDLVREVAAAEGVTPDTPYGVLRKFLRQRRRPFVLLVDAVGEAPEREGSERPGEIAAVLRDLAAIPAMRVITAVPATLLGVLRPAERLDLDDPRWDSEAELHAYACRMLLGSDEPGTATTRSPAGVSPRAAEVVARARGNRLLIRLLAQQPEEHAAGDAGTPTIGPAFRVALRARCRDDAEFRTMSALLSGLAFAHGAGLPWGGRLWPKVMAKVFNDGEPLHSEDIRRLLDVAGPFLVEALDSAGRTVYRLYHETFAEELRSTAPAHAREDILEALLKEFQERHQEAQDHPADPYLRDHLPAHAEDVGADPAGDSGPKPPAPAAVADTDTDRPGQGVREVLETVLFRLVARVLDHLSGVEGGPRSLGRFRTVIVIGSTARARDRCTTTEDGRHRIVVETSSPGDLVFKALRGGSADR